MPLLRSHIEATTTKDGLSAEEERQLARRWIAREDRDALARLIGSHLGLVVSIAQQFRHAGPPLEDLIQEGNVGLTIAARRFDPGQGTRLSTYASYWIRACIMELVVRSHGPVRIGTTRAQRKIFFGLGRARRRIEATGTVASTEALALALGIEPAELDAMLPRLSGHDLSLDAPLGGGDARSVGDVLRDEAVDPEELVGDAEEAHRRKRALVHALQHLDRREREILRARFFTSEPVTLGVLGRRLRVSRERVRQLELRAVAKLRSACAPSVQHRSTGA